MSRETIDTSLDLKHINEVLKSKDCRCYLTWQKVKLYDINALEFLSYTKEDFKEDNDRGRVNALTNAKRAVECRLDEILLLLNFGGFATRKAWNLPYKIEVLKTFDISAPSILRNLIASKRNLLEHKYAKPDHGEVQNILDVAELYLKVTKEYLERGYITVAEFPCSTQCAEEVKIGRGLFGEGKRSRWKFKNITYAPYTLTFNLEGEALKVTRSQGGMIQASNLECGEIQQQDLPGTEIWVNKLSIRECSMEDVRELMLLLQEKAR